MIAEPVPVEEEPPPSRGLARTIGFGLTAANWDEGFRIAKVLAASKLIPIAYQGRPEDVVVAMQYGAELGLPPMAALQSIAVINGKPSIYGDGFLGVVQASPRYVKHREYFIATGEIVYGLKAADFEDDETRAVAQFWRRGIPEPFVAEFSIADAKRAGLWTKSEGWTKYPARMLKHRARGYAARDAFAADLRGLRPQWEVEDEEEIVVEATPAPITPPMRRSEKPQPEPAPAPEPRFQPPFVEPPPPPRKRGRPPKHPQPPAQPQPLPIGTAATLTTDLVITETAYLTPPNAEPYYEICARVEKPGVAPATYTFVTRDESLYNLACSAEGTAQPFAMTWRREKRNDAADWKVLEEIAAS